MLTPLQQAIRVVRTLSSHDKVALLQVLSDDLAQSTFFVQETNRFWATPSLEDIIAAHPSTPILDIHTLAVDFWPPEESADDFNQFIASQRHKDRTHTA